ncbi:MAG: hypothetical protein COX90_03550 [Candidatus Nealsonbacteria bacterium CG_4_10_14_0_2_um_filter_38_17]|uniref:4-vinyl reductase 4VR domain-containing protein n=2 Tax=Candidatus Nealsoniibacteriota TaxID=1817911 RepID=A0A2M7UXD6_9BACT|nr:MAG: hypothetical protein COX36_03695 [Candidatus Nealsonbacteria bacterium CG23_combo_of_CG06-09_8_20_14_all_38_19]PIZ88636.1 MAG: hypothetical protein COX90_03550 [Candidatus Nealsonbacteria bacterium CG_4_10_14_0_2_um_filter_38_17]
MTVIPATSFCLNGKNSKTNKVRKSMIKEILTKEILTKELAKELMEIKGEARGVVFKTDADSILKQKGREGLRRVEKRLKEVDYPIEYGKIKEMDFYPIGLRAVSLLAIKEVFNFSKEDIKKIGTEAPKISFIIKLFTQYFFSLNQLAQKAADIWQRHYTIGQLSAKVNEKEGYAILEVHDLVIHPVFCSYLEGYFLTILRMLVKKTVISEESKCTFKGDEYHEFLLKW